MKTILAVSAVVVCAAGVALAATRRPPEKEVVCPRKRCEITTLETRWPDGVEPGPGGITIGTPDFATKGRAVQALRKAVKGLDGAGDSCAESGEKCYCLPLSETPTVGEWKPKTAKVMVQGPPGGPAQVEASYGYEIRAKVVPGVCARDIS